MDSKNANGSSLNVWKYVESRASQHADKIVQVDATTGETLNFKQLSDTVEQYASSFKKLNISGGAVICSEDNLTFCAVLLGAFHAGVRCTLLATTYGTYEIRRFLNISRPSIVLCSKLVSEKVYDGKSLYDICAEYPCVQHVYVWGTETNSDTYKSLSSLTNDVDSAESDEGFDALENETCEEEDREALVIPSRGMTGMLNGVILTHKAIVETLKSGAIYASSDDVALGLIPMFHVFGTIIGLISLCEGSTFVTMSEYQGVENVRDVIVKYQVSALHVLPVVLKTMCWHPSLNAEALSSVRNVWIGSGMVSERVLDLAREKFANATLSQTFGLTEMTFVTFIGHFEKPNTLGKLAPNMEFRIVKNGKICEPHCVGELQLRGPMLMKGYLNNDEATIQSFDDGWLKTGDFVYRDAEDYFFIVGSTEEIIKYENYRVFPAEIDAIISLLPDILEVAVVGFPNNYVGELPAAAVVVKEDSKLTAEYIEEHVAKHVPPFKRIRAGVYFFKTLPKTESGKISRPATLELIKKALMDRWGIPVRGRSADFPVEDDSSASASADDHRSIR